MEYIKVSKSSRQKKVSFKTVFAVTTRKVELIETVSNDSVDKLTRLAFLPTHQPLLPPRKVREDDWGRVRISVGIHCSKFLRLKGLMYMYPGIQNKEIFSPFSEKLRPHVAPYYSNRFRPYTRKRKYDSTPHRACAVCCFTSSYMKTSAPVCIPAQVTKTVFSGDRFQKPTFENLLF